MDEKNDTYYVTHVSMPPITYLLSSTLDIHESIQ